MASIYKITIPGAVVQRGFWLYVWRVHAPKGKKLLYVGRTGDSSSSNAASAYNRVGQHLGYSKSANSVRRLLAAKGITPEDCKVHEVIIYGPIYSEVKVNKKLSKDEKLEKHKPYRDIMAALEKRLCDTLTNSGYSVLNVVRSRKFCDEKIWKKVRRAFLKDFPKMK